MGEFYPLRFLLDGSEFPECGGSEFPELTICAVRGLGSNMRHCDLPWLFSCGGRLQELNEVNFRVLGQSNSFCVQAHSE